MNSPAFQKLKGDPIAYKEYLAEVQVLSAVTGKEKDIDLCIRHLDKYVTLLKDHHSGIGFNLKRIDLSTPERISEFKASANYLKFERLFIDTARLLSTLGGKKLADIEGIYGDGRTTVFGIIKKKGSPGKYIGVILKPNKFLDIGHVLLELTKKQNNVYDVTYNTGLLGFNFQKIFKTLSIENGQIWSLGFSKTSKPVTRGKVYEFKVLDKSTNYLRLGSFDRTLTEELDSFYNVIDKEILARPYLIIDLRNNGGGSEGSYLNLLKYAYTQPLKIDTAEVWISPENIKRYEETGADRNRELIKRMKEAKPFTFIPQTEDASYTWKLDSGTIFPRKIALLFNRGSASAAEGMIDYFNQSEKVITIGENSGGFMGYGNVMTTQMPCDKFTIQSSTIKYSKKSKYEFIGIEPMYKLSKKQDWIQYAKILLNEPK